MIPGITPFYTAIVTNVEVIIGMGNSEISALCREPTSAMADINTITISLNHDPFVKLHNRITTKPILSLLPDDYHVPDNPFLSRFVFFSSIRLEQGVTINHKLNS
jgi:hypothetical protein